MDKNDDKYLETNDENWYKLCRKEVSFKQMSVDDYIAKDNKIEKIRVKVI